MHERNNSETRGRNKHENCNKSGVRNQRERKVGTINGHGLYQNKHRDL